MPLYTTMGLAPARPLDINDYQPTFGEYMKAAWDDIVNDNPGTVASNMAQASEARYGFDVMDASESGGLVGGLDELRDAMPLPSMSMDEQKAYIKNEGLEGRLSPGEHYTREELEFLVGLKRDEIDRRITREQAPAWMAPFGFAAGLAASMLDPINLATSFVPVVGEARVMSMLAKASGPWGRAGVRAAVGAVEGAVGAAIVEPMVAAGKSELQQEYDFADSLMNIVFGAGMGAAMHPLSGAIGDWKRARKGQRQPWEYVPSSNATENLRMENARSIWKGMQESGSEKLSPEHAEAAAALWDATLRGYAYDTGELVENLYRQYRTEYRGGKVEILRRDDGGLEQSMYRAKEDDIPRFFSRVLAGGQQAKKSYFLLPGSGVFEGWEIRVPSDTAFHQKKRHPDMTDADNERLPEVFLALRDIEPSAKAQGQYGKPFLASAEVDGQGYGVVFEVNHKGQLFVTTFFKDSDERLQAWLWQEKKKASTAPAASETESAWSPGVSHGRPVEVRIWEMLEGVKAEQKERASTSTGAGGNSSSPKSLSENEVRVLEALTEDSMPESASESNTLFQTAYHGTPHKFDEFSLEHIGEGEGNQAHGWGLYFAQEKKVSEDYRSRLTGPGRESKYLGYTAKRGEWHNDEGQRADDVLETVLNYLSSAKGDVEEAKTALNRAAQKWSFDVLLKKAETYLDENFTKQGIYRVENEAPLPGQLFEVDIPENDVLLDEQKPLSEQPHIARLLDEYAEKIGERSFSAEEGFPNDWTGREIYREISEQLGSPRAASEYLNAAGIKGITYDGQQDGRSFVVFDDKAIQVLNTFYQGQRTAASEAKLAEDAEAWAGIVDGLKRKPREPQLMLSQTPLVFHLLGADFREVYAAPHVFDGMFPNEARKGHNAHTNINAGVLKQLPAALADPIAVFGSDSVAGRLVFMVDVTDVNGATVILPVQLDATVGSNKANMHIITSAYSKEKKGVPNNKWFETQAGNLLYVNRKKEAQWVDAAGSNSLWSVSTALGKKNILTEADLVKERELFPGYYQSPESTEPRARVTFGEADAYAVVEFFKAADPSSAPHEMYHIFRRIMSEMYEDPNASEALKERYRKACEFVGAEPGKSWTPEQEEKFARAGERFLLEGVTPTPQMGDVMESFQQWMAEIYGNAERSGLEISDGMREVFSGMMGTSEDGDMNFRYVMGKLLDYRPEAGIDTHVELPADASPDQMLEAYTADSTVRADEAFQALADKPQVQEVFRQEYEADMAAADTAVAEAQKMTEIRQAAAACIMRG